MKTNVLKGLLLALPIVVLASAGLAKNPHSPQRKEISHLFSQAPMTNAGVIADAQGSVLLHVNGQSKGKPLDVRVQVRNLEANVEYQLAALIDAQSNFTTVASFTTDAHGNANLEFRDKAKGPASKHPVPGGLNPISSVHELAILDATNQVLLDANLSQPTRFEYLLKRDIGTNSVSATLQINGNTHGSQVRISARGLDANSAYSLSLNGGAVATENTDANGRLQIGFELAQPTDIFNLQSVELLDAASNVVASTSLP